MNIGLSLRIMGDKYNVEEVTERLNIYPTTTWHKGEEVRKTGHKYLYTAWIYDIELEETLDIGIPVKKFMELFSPKSKDIAILKKNNNLNISIDFVIIIEEKEVPAVYFDQDFIKLVTEIEAVIDVDMYIN